MRLKYAPSILVSLTDDDTFPNHKFSHIVPEAIKQVDLPCVYDSSHGVLCTFGYNNLDIGSYMAVLWNPIVKKSVGIVIPRSGSSTRCSLGFGVCPNTSDPKIIKINIYKKPCVHWEIQVFTLSSRVWKSISIDPPSKLCHFVDHVPIEGFVYWLGYGESESTTNFIIYFNLKSDEFGEVCLPDNLVHSTELAISKQNENLVVLEYCYESEIPVCDVWMMMDCVTKSLTKMFSFKLPRDRMVLGFRMNGDAIMEIIDCDGKSMLEVYESFPGDFNAIGIQGDYLSFYVSSYTGSLLLLDQSDSIIH
ncbi:F-box domain containing protein [Tanacetum coccineum]